MDKSKRKLILESVGFVCAVIVVVLSASSLEGRHSTVQILGLAAASFAAGATSTCLVEDFRRRRRSGKEAHREVNPAGKADPDGV